MPSNIQLSSELLQALNYSSVEEAALEMMRLSARSRYAELCQEVKRFAEKYGQTLTVAQQAVEEKVNDEDFEQEEDLMAWQFAHEAAECWRQMIDWWNPEICIPLAK
ncbi:MAG: hypothetical protein HYZ50_13220 [Deltaproteobacteria bacterium]|nr:hypothetical protein [Deltaproteobacteria bacterium]